MDNSDNSCLLCLRTFMGTVVPKRLARFGTANHGLRGVRAGFWTNRAKNPNTHFSLARYFGKKMIARRMPSNQLKIMLYAFYLMMTFFAVPSVLRTI